MTNLIILSIFVTTNWVSHTSITNGEPLYSVEITAYDFGFMHGTNSVKIGTFHASKIMTSNAPNPTFSEVLP